jgi:hypothetical protein
MTRVAKANLITAAALILTAQTMNAAPPVRPYTAGNFGLEIDGTFVGAVTKVEGGNAVGDVAKLAGEEFFVKKQLTNFGVRDIVLEFGAGMHGSLYDWIQASLKGQQMAKSGAVLTMDYQGTVQARLAFTDALITQITFPAADGSSKDALRFTIRLTPETTTFDRSPGGKASTKALAPKPALASAFRLSIDGLDMSKVSGVEALTINLPSHRFGKESFRFESKMPAQIDFPNVMITMSQTQADSVYDWFEKFVIGGNNGDEAEKNGTLEFLTANLSTTVFELTFKQLGIFEISPVPAANADAVAKIMVAMYCEQIEFAHFGKE